VKQRNDLMLVLHERHRGRTGNGTAIEPRRNWHVDRRAVAGVYTVVWSSSARVGEFRLYMRRLGFVALHVEAVPAPVPANSRDA